MGWWVVGSGLQDIGVSPGSGSLSQSKNLSEPEKDPEPELDNILIEHGGLPHVLPLDVRISYDGCVEGILLFGFFCGTPP